MAIYLSYYKYNHHKMRYYFKIIDYAENDILLKPIALRIATCFDIEKSGKASGPKHIPMHAQRFAGMALRVACIK